MSAASESKKPAGQKPHPAQPDEIKVDLSSPEHSTSPSMPHERDQHTGMTGGVPSPRVEQGARDVKRGLEDTTGGTETDTAYRKLKRP